MDLLLSHGFFLALDPSEQRVMRPYPPLGLLYLSSHLKARGVDVGVFDSTFATPRAFEHHLASVRPRAVGLYANLLTRSRVLDLIQLAKEHGAFVILGGPDPSNYPEEYLAHGADVVVIGEGELTLDDLLGRVLESGSTRDFGNVAGIVYLEGETVMRTPARSLIDDLDGQPFPDREAIDIPAYVNVWRQHHGQGSVSLITARGCPYECTWCSHSVFGYTHRRRSPANVADELALVVDRYRPDIVWYADDVFTIHQHWLTRYRTELERRSLRVPFETITREDRLNVNIVETLAAMGCFRIWIGSESGSQRVLDSMRRRTNVERVRAVVHLLQQHGIQAGLFIMLGYDGEELTDLEATVEHLKRTGADQVLTTVAYPIKGTPFYQKVEKRLVATKAWANGSDRDLSIAGRRSRRFYSFATRWMVNEVAAHRQRTSREIYSLSHLRAVANAGIGKMGMWLTQHEREKGVGPQLDRHA